MDKAGSAAARDEGNAFFRKGRWRDAAESYARAGALDGTDAVPWANRAMAWLKLERYADAEEDATRALDRDARNVKAAYRRALARRGLGDLRGALGDLEGVLVREPGNVAAKGEMEEVVRELAEKGDTAGATTATAATATTATTKATTRATEKDAPRVTGANQARDKTETVPVSVRPEEQLASSTPVVATAAPTPAPAAVPAPATAAARPSASGFAALKSSRARPSYATGAAIPNTKPASTAAPTAAPAPAPPSASTPATAAPVPAPAAAAPAPTPAPASTPAPAPAPTTAAPAPTSASTAPPTPPNPESTAPGAGLALLRALTPLSHQHAAAYLRHYTPRTLARILAPVLEPDGLDVLLRALDAMDTTEEGTQEWMRATFDGLRALPRWRMTCGMLSRAERAVGEHAWERAGGMGPL